MQVQEKEKAQADIDLALNERQQQLIIANTQLNVTTQQAQITIANANTAASVTLLQANATVRQHYVLAACFPSCSYSLRSGIIGFWLCWLRKAHHSGTVRAITMHQHVNHINHHRMYWAVFLAAAT
jgi:hypothetical protein